MARKGFKDPDGGTSAGLKAAVEVRGLRVVEQMQAKAQRKE